MTPGWCQCDSEGSVTEHVLSEFVAWLTKHVKSQEASGRYREMLMLKSQQWTTYLWFGGWTLKSGEAIQVLFPVMLPEMQHVCVTVRSDF